MHKSGMQKIETDESGFAEKSLKSNKHTTKRINVRHIWAQGRKSKFIIITPGRKDHPV